MPVPEGAEAAEDEPVAEGSSGTEANPDGADDKPEDNNTESDDGEPIDVVDAPTNELSAPRAAQTRFPKVLH
jgi:hypothetical protein